MSKLLFVGYLVCLALPLSANQESASVSGGTVQQSSCADSKNFAKCFKSVYMADGSTPDGFKYGENAMIGPSGKTMIRRNVYYASQEQAQQEFKDRLKLTKVIEKHEYPRRGSAIALIDAQEAKNPDRVTLIEVEGAVLRTFESASPQDVRIIANLQETLFETRYAAPDAETLPEMSSVLL